MLNMVLIVDTETTGLWGCPHDRVVDIGIASYDEQSDRVTEVYSSLVNYPDMEEYCRDKVESEGAIWIFGNSDISLDRILSEGKDVSVVSEEIRSILKGEQVTCYNVPFDFKRFLSREPWSLDCVIPYDIMNIATDAVCEMMDSGAIGDTPLVRRLQEERRWFSNKRLRMIDSYHILCSDDPMDLTEQRHRALDDAMAEGHILRAVMHRECSYCISMSDLHYGVRNDAD